MSHQGRLGAYPGRRTSAQGRTEGEGGSVVGSDRLFPHRQDRMQLTQLHPLSDRALRPTLCQLTAKCNTPVRRGCWSAPLREPLGRQLGPALDVASQFSSVVGKLFVFTDRWEIRLNQACHPPVAGAQCDIT